MIFLLQHQAIRGPLSENINTIVSTALITLLDGKMRLSTYPISTTGEGETGLNVSGRDGDCHVTWHILPETKTHG